METKKILPIGGFFAIAIGVATALGFFVYHGPSTPTTTAGAAHYSSADLNFDYSKTYTLQTRADNFAGEDVTVLTLIDTSIAVPDMSEGPPGIAVLVVPNPERLPLGVWVKDKSISLFYLSSEQILSSTTVGGKEAVKYKYSGLYENDAVAVAHEGRVYLFFGSWGAATDPIRADFQNLLKTVTFE